MLTQDARARHTVNRLEERLCDLSPSPALIVFVSDMPGGLVIAFASAHRRRPGVSTLKGALSGQRILQGRAITGRIRVAPAISSGRGSDA